MKSTSVALVFCCTILLGTVVSQQSEQDQPSQQLQAASSTQTPQTDSSGKGRCAIACFQKRCLWPRVVTVTLQVEKITPSAAALGIVLVIGPTFWFTETVHMQLKRFHFVWELTKEHVHGLYFKMTSRATQITAATASSTCISQPLC